MGTELSKQIKEIAMLRGEFILKSGKISDTYFDKYRFESNPKLLEKIAKEMVKLIPPNAEKLAGLEMGGIPLVTMISHFSGLPASFVRKEAKKYGTCKYIEGMDLDSKDRIVIVEDVITSGSEVIKTIDRLKKDGIVPIAVICCIDRERGGVEEMVKRGIEVKALFTKSDIENS